MNLTKIKNECYDAMVEAIKSELNSEGIDGHIMPALRSTPMTDL